MGQTSTSGISNLLWYQGLGVSLTLCCFVVYSTRRFVVCLTMCQFDLVFFSPFSIAITSLGEERANLSAFRTFVRFVLVWTCRFPLPLGVWEGLRFVIVALPGLFSYSFFIWKNISDDTQEMPQSRSIAFQGHQKKGRWGTNDKTNAIYKTTALE